LLIIGAREIMKFDKLIGKKITLFTRKNYRFQGVVKDFDGKFLEIFDEVRKKPKNIHIDNIVEFEVEENFQTKEEEIKEPSFW
jgi:hypothetical protein